MNDTTKRVILGHHLRAIAQLARKENEALSITSTKKAIKLEGFAKLLQNFIVQLPRLSAEASGRGKCGVNKKFHGYGCFAKKPDDQDDYDLSNIEETDKVTQIVKPLMEYCLKHSFGLLIKREINDLQIIIVWEKPLPDSWGYNYSEINDWLIPYNVS